MKSEQIGEIDTCEIPTKGANRGRHGKSPGIWAKAISALLNTPDGDAVSLRVRVAAPPNGTNCLGLAARRAGISIRIRADRETDGIVKFTIWRRVEEPK